MKTMLASEAKRETARLLVSSMYATWDVASIEEVLAVGRKYEAELPDKEEVVLMNQALVAEIERRKAAR